MLPDFTGQLLQLGIRNGLGFLIADQHAQLNTPSWLCYHSNHVIPPIQIRLIKWYKSKVAYTTVQMLRPTRTSLPLCRDSHHRSAPTTISLYTASTGTHRIRGFNSVAPMLMAYRVQARSMRLRRYAIMCQAWTPVYFLQPWFEPQLHGRYPSPVQSKVECPKP